MLWEPHLIGWDELQCVRAVTGCQQARYSECPGANDSDLQAWRVQSPRENGNPKIRSTRAVSGPEPTEASVGLVPGLWAQKAQEDAWWEVATQCECQIRPFHCPLSPTLQRQKLGPGKRQLAQDMQIHSLEELGQGKAAAVCHGALVVRTACDSAPTGLSQRLSRATFACLSLLELPCGPAWIPRGAPRWSQGHGEICSGLERGCLWVHPGCVSGDGVLPSPLKGHSCAGQAHCRAGSPNRTPSSWVPHCGPYGSRLMTGVTLGIIVTLRGRVGAGKP